MRRALLLVLVAIVPACSTTPPVEDPAPEHTHLPHLPQDSAAAAGPWVMEPAPDEALTPEGEDTAQPPEPEPEPRLRDESGPPQPPATGGERSLPPTAPSAPRQQEPAPSVSEQPPNPTAPDIDPRIVCDMGHGIVSAETHEACEGMLG